MLHAELAHCALEVQPPTVEPHRRDAPHEVAEGGVVTSTQGWQRPAERLVEVDEVGRAAAPVEASEGEQGGRHPSAHLALARVGRLGGVR